MFAKQVHLFLKVNNRLSDWLLHIWPNTHPWINEGTAAKLKGLSCCLLGGTWGSAELGADGIRWQCVCLTGFRLICQKVLSVFQRAGEPVFHTQAEDRTEKNGIMWSRCKSTRRPNIWKACIHRAQGSDRNRNMFISLVLCQSHGQL